MNNELMEQCRREAEEVYPTQAERLRDCGYDEDAVWSACTDQAARRGAYAAALYAERSKGALRYRSECSGLWYTNREAAGDVDAVEVDGVVYVSNKQGQMFDKRRELTDEEIERIAQHVWTAQGWDGEVGCAEGNLLIAGLRYARDNGYLSTGLTVEEVMDIAKEEVFEWWNGERVFHARLTAAIKAKASK